MKIRSTIIAVHCIVFLLTARAQSPALLSTFPNPTPEADDRFSWSVAAVGTDRVLVGAPFEGPTNAGAVYLFGDNGVLLKTFANPHPSYISRGLSVVDGDWFGGAIAGVGTDRVLIGAPYEGPFYSGIVYLFSTDGTLLTTLGSPSEFYAYDSFGYSVAVLGGDRLIIGAPEHTTDPDTGVGIGVAYLLSTNGTLLATFDNPDSEHFRFGWSVAPFGADRVLIGARYGAAHLFDTNGTLQMTFTNPTPANEFGYSVAAVGSDRVFVGAPESNGGAIDAGVACLFHTNGALLTTFSNATSAVGDYFGSRVAVLGSDRLVISSLYDDKGATDSGAAYVFSTSGTLLNTIMNPTPAVGDGFGARLAALGNDRVIIAAPFTDTRRADNVGTAYLLSVPPAPAPPPSLTIGLTASNMVLILWPSPSTGFVLQQNTNGLESVDWSNVTGTIQDNGTNRFMAVSPPAQDGFYRLVKP